MTPQDRDSAASDAQSSSQPDSPAPQAHVSPNPSATTRSTIELPLEASLLPWLDCFHSCSTQWGLITEVRADGTTYERHGIVVELSADITKALEAAGCYADLLTQRIRQAIDLVKLALAVDPLMVKSLLMRRTHPNASLDEARGDKNIDEEELQRLARGDVPFEFRLRLAIKYGRASLPHGALVGTFMRKLDQARVDEMDVLRRFLLEGALASASARRLARPVRTILVLTGPESHPDHCMFSNISWMRDWLERCHRERDPSWAPATNHAPLVIESVRLKLKGIPLQSKILRDAVKLTTGEIPVTAVSMALSFQKVQCREEELDMFLKAVTSGAPTAEPIKIFTTHDGCASTADDRDEDYGTSILMLLRCIGRIEHAVDLDMTGLFAECEERVNLRAIIRGLVKSIMSAGMRFAVSVHEPVLLNGDDAEDILKQVRRWHKNHPEGKLSLRFLHMWPGNGTMRAVRSLLHGLDDLEDLWILPGMGDEISCDDIKLCHRFPSLRSLILENVNIPKMDVFAPFQLEDLDLAVALTDSSSMVAFVKSLNPTHKAASPLSQTLQTLKLVEVGDDGSDEEDEQPNVRLAINDINAVAALDEVLSANRILRYVNFVGKFGQDEVMPVWDADYPAKTSRMTAPVGIRRIPLEMARKAALLSALRQGTCVSARELDSNIVRLVFEFSAPHVHRTVRV